MSATSPTNLSHKQAIQNAVASMDMTALFSGLGAEVTVEFKGKKLQYHLGINDAEVCAYKKKKLQMFFGDKHLSTSPYKADSIACELITELYQCTKLTQPQFHQLLTLPNGVNEYAQRALVALEQKHISDLVNKIVSEPENTNQRRQLTKALEAIPSERVIDCLNQKTHRQLFIILDSDWWTNKETYLEILSSLQNQTFEQYVKCLPEPHLVKAFSQRPQMIDKITNEKIRNWFLNYYLENDPHTLCHYLPKLHQSVISCWIKSATFEKIEKFMFKLDVNNAAKLLLALLDQNTQLTDIVEDEVCIISHETDEEINTIIVNLAKASLDTNETRRKWLTITQQLVDKKLLKLCSIVLPEAPSSIQTDSFEALDTKLLTDWLEQLTTDERLSFFRARTPEERLKLFNRLITVNLSKPAKLIPVFFIREIIDELPCKSALKLLEKIIQHHFTVSSKDKGYLTLLKPLVNVLSRSGETLSSQFNQIITEKNAQNKRHIMLALPREAALTMFNQMDDDGKRQFVPSSDFYNEGILENWCNVLPENYILQRIFEINSIAVFASILGNSRINLKLKEAVNQRVTDNRFDDLVKKHAFKICTHILCFSPERILKIRQNLNFRQWRIVAKKIPNENLKLWIDWDSKLQAEYWISKCGPEHIFDLYQTLSVSQSHKLMNFIPIGYLADLLIQICIKMSYQEAQAFVEHNAAHSKMPILMSEWYNSSYFHCEETVKLLQGLSKENQKLFLEYLSKRRFFEICKELSKISTFVKNGQLVSIYRCRYSTASTKIKKAFRHHKNTLISKSLNVDSFTTEIQGTNTIYYHSKQMIHPPLRLPDEKSSQNKRNAEGGFKKVNKSDGQYISMTVTEIKIDPATKRESTINKPKPPQGHALTEAQVELFQELKKSKIPPENLALSSGALGILINDGESIAADAGEDLINCFSEGISIDDISQLMCLCKTIDFAHNRGFYFRDLKLENILYKKYATRQNGTLVKLPSPKLTIIDLDDLCRIEHQTESEYRFVGDWERWCSTVTYITHQLLVKKFTGDPKWLLAADKYSMCLCILYMLDSKIILFPDCPRKQMQNHNQRARECYYYDLPFKKYRCDKNSIFYYGHFHDKSISREQQNYAKTVIRKYVKPAYQEQFFNFLCDPVTHCLPGELTLEEIFNWQADKES